MNQPRRLPHTEGLASVAFAPIQRTEGIAKLKPIGKHPALVASERVLRDLYRVIAEYDQHNPGILPKSARESVLVLREALIHHSLVEQSIRLQIALAEIRACPAIAKSVRVYAVLAAVEAFLTFPLPEEQC